MSDVRAIPKGYHTVTPLLVVTDIGEALDFYQRAFGARVTTRQEGPSGDLMHGEVEIGDSRVMFSPAHSESCESGASKGCNCSMMLYVEDVEAAMDRAISAGASKTMDVEEMFWGDMMGQVTDPFGHSWSICTHVEDLSPDEITHRAQEFFASHSHQ